MKRISDVFELPLVSMQEADDQLQDANGDWALIVRLPWRADYAAHAINHADALADALESMLEHEKEMAYSVWDYRDGRAAIFEQSEEFAIFNDSFADELAALTAYRGAK